jgi:GTP cyclohydrolase III
MTKRTDSKGESNDKKISCRKGITIGATRRVMASKSQNAAILMSLLKGKSVTPMDALKSCGCFRLSARIRELRDIGFTISSGRFKTQDGKIVAIYRIGK